MRIRLCIICGFGIGMKSERCCGECWRCGWRGWRASEEGSGEWGKDLRCMEGVCKAIGV